MEIIFQKFMFFLLNAIIYGISTIAALNIKKPIIYLLITLITIPTFSIVFRFLLHFTNYIYAPIMCIVLLALLMFFSESNKKITILFFVFHNIVMIFSEYISAALVFFILHIESTYTYEIVIKNMVPFRTAYYIIYMLSVSILVFAWNKIPFLITKDISGLYNYIPVILSQMGFLWIMTELLQSNVSHSASWYIKILASGILFAISQVSMVFLLRFQEKRLKKENKQNALFHAIRTQFDQFQQMILQEKSRAKFHHDLNNQLQTISALYSMGDYEAALQYLQKLLHMTTLQQHDPFCANPTINALLSQKKTICESENLKLDVLVNLSPNFSMDEMVLCSIFGNILDNAIQASRICVNTCDRKIILRASHKSGFLLVSCNNPIPDVPIIDEKRNHWGLEIISDIAAQYNGDLSTRRQNGRFILELSIETY